MKSPLLFTLLAMVLLVSFSQNSYLTHFETCNVADSTTIFDYQTKAWTTTSLSDSQLGTLPASSFKIVNTLIALETQAVADEHELIPWIDDYMIR